MIHRVVNYDFEVWQGQGYTYGGDSRAALRPGNFNHEVKISIYVAGFHLEAKNTLRYFKAGKKELG